MSISSKDIKRIDKTEPPVIDDMKELLKDTAPFLLLLFASAMYMGYVEGWSIVTSIYYFVITGTTGENLYY